MTAIDFIAYEYQKANKLLHIYYDRRYKRFVGYKYSLNDVDIVEAFEIKVTEILLFLRNLSKNE